MLKNRILTVAITLCLLISSFTFSAFAAGEATAVTPPTSNDSVPVTTAAPERPPYYIDYDNYYCLYVGRPAELTHYRVYEFIANGHKNGEKYPIIEALNRLPRLPEIAVDNSAKTYIDMLFINNQGNKRQIYITPNALNVGGKAYKLTDEQYFDLLGTADDSLLDSKLPGFPRWFLYTNPYSVNEIICTDETGRTFQIKPENIAIATNYLKNTTVSYASTYKPGGYDFSNVKNCFRITLNCKNDVVIKIYYTNTSVYIESSGIPFACKYETDFRPYVSDYFKQAETGTPKAPTITNETEKK